jgi:hypothetical protein
VWETAVHDCVYARLVECQRGPQSDAEGSGPILAEGDQAAPPAALLDLNRGGTEIVPGEPGGSCWFGNAIEAIFDGFPSECSQVKKRVPPPVESSGNDAGPYELTGKVGSIQGVCHALLLGEMTRTNLPSRFSASRRTARRHERGAERGEGISY